MRSREDYTESIEDLIGRPMKDKAYLCYYEQKNLSEALKQMAFKKYGHTGVKLVYDGNLYGFIMNHPFSIIESEDIGEYLERLYSIETIEIENIPLFEERLKSKIGISWGRRSNCFETCFYIVGKTSSFC